MIGIIKFLWSSSAYFTSFSCPARLNECAVILDLVHYMQQIVIVLIIVEHSVYKCVYCHIGYLYPYL
jgi:hypothetical protein